MFHDVGVRELALEGAVGALLVGGHDERVPGGLEEVAQAQLARHAADQLTGREVEPARRRRRLPIRIALDRRHVVARIGRRVAVDRIVIQDA